jgi:ribosomal protein S18 acetylase RimI-like enzyme
MKRPKEQESSANILVQPLSPDLLDEAASLFRAIAAQSNPQDPSAGDNAEAGFRQSLGHYDLTGSDAIWVLLAWVNAQLAGYTVAVRIPKLDSRHGFLFVDELHVLAPYRRKGVATRLLEAVGELAREADCAGVRLLVRPSNSAARGLYRHLHFVEHPAILCEWEWMQAN